MKKTSLSFLVILVIIIVFWFFWVSIIRDTNLERESERWATLIEEMGANQAFKNFVNIYEDKNFRLQHLAAHLLGGLIFEKEGVSGWTDCGGEFFYGCYHGFFARAVSFHGEDIISELDDICANIEGRKKGTCYHGIGHGLIEYMGSENLEAVLSLCSNIDDGTGCAKGAFMEYNSPLIFQEDALFVRAREFDSREPYGLCEKTPPEFKEACYYELGWWWGNLFGNNYGKMEGLCERIDVDSYKKSCFEGVERVKIFERL